MAITYKNNPIVRNGLIMHLDATNVKSYPGSGTVWKDISGNKNNAALVNGPTYNTNDSKYFSFDGVNDYGIIPHSSSLVFTNQLTVSVWFKRVSGAIQRLVNKYDSPEDAVFKITVGSGGRIFFEINDGTTRYILGNVFPTFSGDWENFVFVYDGSNRYIYQNTNVIASDAFTNNITNTTNPITIGATVLTDTLYGPLDIASAMIYNRALSETEIQQNFNIYRGRFGL